jgi:hypothetical protein
VAIGAGSSAILAPRPGVPRDLTAWRNPHVLGAVRTPPHFGRRGGEREWWRLQDGVEHVCSQLVLAREGFSAMLGQVDSELVALEREVVPLGRV